MTNRGARRLNFARKAALAFAGIAAVAAPVVVGVMNAPVIQAASAARPKLEAASIKSYSDEPERMRGAGYSSSPGMLTTGCMPLVDEANLGLIQRAYVRFAGGRPHWPGIVPIEGGPDWVRSELYTMSANTSKAGEDPSQEMMEGPMMQALLEDRFQMKIHRETRKAPVYVLTAAQGGSLLKPFVEGSCTPMPLKRPMPAPSTGQEYCKVTVGMKPVIDAQGSTLGEFSQLLDLVLDRPVIDKTGIAGKFDIHLEFAAGAGSDSSIPSIFAAIQRLGLKLEAGEGPCEFL